MRFLIIVLSFFPCFMAAQDLTARADALLSAYHKNDQFTGTVLIAKNGKVIFEKGYGQANRNSHQVNNAFTEYRIGSVSKPFTATLILKLQEKGFLSIKDPLSKYLPDYPNGDSVLLENLLNHTSGIKSISSMKQYYAEWIGEKTDLPKTISRFKNEAFHFSPGKKYEYSNSNYILLSYVAELAAGSSFESLLDHYILKPLKLEHTGLDKNDRISAQKALGYQASPETDYAPARFNDMSIMMGAGSMYSTARDLFAFDRALDGDRLISAESGKQMYAVHKNNYGLGWEIDSAKGKLRISHSGSIDGFLSNFIRFPEQDVCIVFLSNYFNSKGPQISKALISIVFDEPYEMPLERKFVAIPVDELKMYSGAYQMEKGPALEVFIEDGKLKGRLEQQQAFVMLPQSNGEFYIKSIDTDVVFEIKDKALVGMKLKQGKKVMEFKAMRN